LCQAVGESWMRGELSVYQEHLFTEAVQAVLRDAITAVHAGGRQLQHKPKVLLTTTPSEQHALGLLMAECFFAMEACERVSLGPCTPIPDIVVAVRQLHIDVVALSFSSHASRREVADSLQQLVDQLPPAVEVWAGGAGVAAYRKGWPDRTHVLRRATDVGQCVQQWRQRHGH
jgi:MerR family transcriptional regulator, light-induced transcriptional regulator